jgi:hypothetical protein
MVMGKYNLDYPQWQQVAIEGPSFVPVPQHLSRPSTWELASCQSSGAAMSGVCSFEISVGKIQWFGKQARMSYKKKKTLFASSRRWPRRVSPWALG